MASEKTHIVIAEASPVLASGLSHCLQRLPGIQARVIEVGSETDLRECLATSHAEILLADPAFGGGFNPVKMRESLPPTVAAGLRIAAIEVGKIDRATASLYDEVVNIVDDMETLAAKIRTLARDEEQPAPAASEKEALSNREKEIVTLVVKGMTNKEIADKLFLSVHTVITHRRNIARKLEIHSPTGLTIYAIGNHLVDITSVNL